MTLGAADAYVSCTHTHCVSTCVPDNMGWPVSLWSTALLNSDCLGAGAGKYCSKTCSESQLSCMKHTIYYMIESLNILSKASMSKATYRVFLDAQASLAPTHIRVSVRPSVGLLHFRISNLSASLVALREKLKREDPNYFLNFLSPNFLLVQKTFLTPKTFLTQKKFDPKN